VSPTTGSAAVRRHTGDVRSLGAGRDAARDLAAAAALVALAAVAVAHLAGFGAGYVAKSLAVYAVGAALIRRGLTLHHPHSRFGAGNRVTLSRFAMTALFVALIGEPLAQREWMVWALVVAATLTALLDAADGALARRSGLASEFGARFDMETDAWFTLVLCTLVLQLEKAGGWVLVSGLMRYVFVAAALVWPWLGAPLPAKRRRQAVCVTQITVLIVCLGPIIPAAASAVLAALGLAALVLSFAIDVRWLRRAHSNPGSSSP